VHLMEEEEVEEVDEEVAEEGKGFILIVIKGADLNESAPFFSLHATSYTLNAFTLTPWKQKLI